MSVGFIQIYRENYVCCTIRKDVPKIVVLVTGESQYLKHPDFNNDDCLERVSQLKFVDILGTYTMSNEDIKLIFQHAKDKILNVIVSNGILDIIGDDGILYSRSLNNSFADGAGLMDINQEIMLQGSKDWLQANNLEFF